MQSMARIKRPTVESVPDTARAARLREGRGIRRERPGGPFDEAARRMERAAKLQGNEARRVAEVRALFKDAEKVAGRGEGAPTAHRVLHAGETLERGDEGLLSVRQAPLERMQARRGITDRQYNAGDKFRLHWHWAGLSGAPGSVDLNRIFAPDIGTFIGMAKTEMQVFHRQRYREAVQHLGMKRSRVVEYVLCEEMTLEDAGRKLLGWGNKSQAIAAATEVMRDGLDSLAQLWGIDS